MGFISRIFGKTEKRWHPERDYIITAWLAAAGASDAGVPVTPDVALAHAAILRCVNVIATTLATLPIRIIDRSTLSPVEDHPLDPILNLTINPEQSAVSSREAFMVQALLWGNAYMFIEKDSPDGTPTALWPIRSQQTSPQRYPTSQLFYTCITGAQTYTFTPDQIIHVQDMSYDGIVGLPRVRYGANAIGVSLALEKYAAKFFANGANAAGFLELPAGMKEDAVKKFVESWKRQYVGLDNSFRTGLLTDGMRYTKTGIEPQRGQMLDSRTFQVREVARLFGVPLHKIADMEQATFSNIEQQNIEFCQDTLRPWATKIERELERKLLKSSEQRRLNIRFDLDELLRGDTTTRYNAYHLALSDGWKTRNEVRRCEGLPPIPGGDTPLQPLNMGAAGGNPADPASKAKPAKPAKKPTKSPAAEPDDESENDDEQ